ncbi:MAG TPA: SAM-dependent methyltransferase [Cellvibrio sp.]|nr:SAM-dependent methyltransferase [Cellvibrio sp.]
MILSGIFENKMTGFYVDVGAHHPKRFSNTFFFYRRGWRGINIDAMPGSMEAFKRSRSRDINIEQPISDKNEFLTYYAFNEPALNGFSKSISNERDGQGGYKIIFTKDLQTNTLDEVLAKNLPDDVEKIDFLSIDVEGFDFRVLKSINLDVHKPEVILVEMLKSGLTDLNDSEITKYLGGFGYSIYSKAVNTVFFRRTCHS